MQPTTIAVLMVFVAGPASACRSQPAAVDPLAAGTAQATSGSPAPEVPMESQAKNDHLTVDHRVLDIVNHPAFKGFGELTAAVGGQHQILRHAAGPGRLAHAIPQSRGRRRRRGRSEPPDRRSGCRQDDLLRVLYRAAEAGGSGQEAHRPLLLPGKAGGAVRHRLSWEEDSPTSARSTKASRSPGRSARRGSTPS